MQIDFTIAPPAPAPANADPLGNPNPPGDVWPYPVALPRNSGGSGLGAITRLPSSDEPAREDDGIQLFTGGIEAGAAQSAAPTAAAVVPSGEQSGQKRVVPSASPVSPVKDEWRMAEANRRIEVLASYRAAIESGLTVAEAARRVGESVPTLWRWSKRFERAGFDGLIPNTAHCGRKSALAKLGLTEDEIRRVRGINLDTQSNTAAWRAFAQSDECREEVARVILDPGRCSKHALPPSLRRATKLTDSMRLAHRGPRALSLGGIWTPRKLDILPGDIFCSDDTTPIWAWWVPWVECEEYPFGVKLLQGQLLPVIDVASQCPVTHVIIAREQSSYRAADIWRLFGHTFETVGLPRLGWQLERGSWEADIIRGVKVDYEEGGATLSRRIGGLRQLPSNALDWHRERMDGAEFPKTLQTWTSFLPKTKSIEAFFDRSQTIEGTLWGCLGRDQMRRPFEKAKQVYEACRRGKLDPRQHFLSWDEMSRRIGRLLEYIANEPVEGEVFAGVPRLLWENAVREHPLYRLPDYQRWLYARYWKVVTITQGWARVRLTDELSGKRYSLFYSAPELFAAIEGQQVMVYYDRENFERPAELISMRTGEYLGQARYVERRGSFLDADQSGHDIRKAWRNAVMAAYGTVVQHAPSRQVPAEIATRRAEAKAAAPAPARSEPISAPEAALSPRAGQGSHSSGRSEGREARPVVSAEDLDLLGGASPEARPERPERADRSEGVALDDLDLL